MTAIAEATGLFARFGEILAYPGPGLENEVQDLRGALAENGEACAQKLDIFLQFLAENPLCRAEEHYTRAFDLAPIAAPYLSVYLFGAENPKRGEFMAGLMAAYARAGYDTGGELPDHLALVLRYAPKAPPEEWDELCATCLPAPLRLMHQALAAAQSPYAAPVDALRAFICAFEETPDA